jgi:hypothetical protein
LTKAINATKAISMAAMAAAIRRPSKAPDAAASITLTYFGVKDSSPESGRTG